MSVLKRRSNNIKDGQYVIAFSDSRALIDISKDCGMTWTRRQPSDLPNVNEYFFSNDRTRIAMSGDGRHIYCSCYMANVGLLRSTDFLETAEPFKPDNCYSVYSIACNGRGNLVAIVCQNSNNKYDLMLSGDYGKTWRVSNGLKDNTVPLMGVEMSHSGRYVVAYASNSPYYTTHELFISSDYGETFSSEIFRGLSQRLPFPVTANTCCVAATGRVHQSYTMPIIPGIMGRRGLKLPIRVSLPVHWLYPMTGNIWL